MIFRTKQKKIQNMHEQIYENDKQICRTDKIKFLGVLIDEHLTWKDHIIEINNSLRRYFPIFYNIRS